LCARFRALVAGRSALALLAAHDGQRGRWWLPWRMVTSVPAGQSWSRLGPTHTWVTIIGVGAHVSTQAHFYHTMQALQATRLVTKK
jgi:hypothetical protein